MPFMNNENNVTVDSSTWNSSQGLGFSVLQRHNKAIRQPGSDLARNHLGRDRISLAADIYRRYNRNSSSVIGGADFPHVNFFSQTSLQSHGRGRENLSQYKPLGMEPLHRMVNISSHSPHIGGKRGLTDIKIRRSSIDLAANQNSSMLIYPSKSSDQSSRAASNTTVLDRMPDSSHISEHAIIRGRAGVIGEKSSVDNSFIVMDTNTNKGHFPSLIQRVVDRQSRKGFILNPVFEGSIARFVPLQHDYAVRKTASMVVADSEFPAISTKAERSSEMIVRQQQISSAVDQSGDNRSQSFVQRAISRQNSVLSQNNYGFHDNNVFKGESARFAGNELWPGHTAHFAYPLVTVNRKFALSSGNRFEGLGIGRKIVGHAVGTLSQQGYAADFIPESAVTKNSPLEYNYADSKTAPMVDAVSGVSAISLKAEPSSEIIARQQQFPSEAVQSGNNRSRSSVQRAVSRQNSVLAQKDDNNVFRSEAVRFAGNELWSGLAPHFVSPLVTVNRKFSLTSGNRFEGLGIGRKIAGLTAGTLSQQGFASNFIPESAITRFAPLEHYFTDSKTTPRADTVSGVPVISPKAEPSSEIIARRERISSEAAQSGNNRSQSSVQRAVSRQNSVLSQNNYGYQDNNVFKGEPSRFAGNDLWTGHTTHFASPLAIVNRKFSLSSGNRFEGLGLGRKIAGRSEGTLSQQGSAADFIPASADMKLAPLEHYYPDSKTAPIADAVSVVPVISRKAEPLSENIGRQEQTLSEAAQSGNNRSQSSVQRAVDRQNSSLSQITAEPRIWHKVPELPITAIRNSESVYSPENTANSFELKPEIISAKREGVYQLNSSPLAYSQQHQHGNPAISSNNNTNGESGNPIHSNSISSLLMRSAIISPARTTHRIQASLSQQQPSIPSSIRRAVARKSDYMLRYNSTRPVETADLNVLTLSSRANLFSSGEESFMPGITRASPIEQGDSFYSDRGMDSATQLPLSQPYVVQRKTALSGDRAAAGDGSGYLQLQEVNNMVVPPPHTTLVQTGETAGPVTGKSDSNALSTDDVVDKVWRKLMRKLVSEQERMGGSNRWA
jgi:hypothetical protein